MVKTVNPTEALRRFVDQHGTQTAAAQSLGISGAYLNDMLHGHRNISPRILAKLGLKTVVVKS